MLHLKRTRVLFSAQVCFDSTVKHFCLSTKLYLYTVSDLEASSDSLVVVATGEGHQLL
jgi:hypothetical protein